MSNQPTELFRRHEHNPILSAADCPYAINTFQSGWLQPWD
jgi:hypothetical protein